MSDETKNTVATDEEVEAERLTVDFILENGNFGTPDHSTCIAISRLIARINTDRAEIAELKQALTGRTVSCGSCNDMAKEIERLKKNDGWCHCLVSDNNRTLHGRCGNCGDPIRGLWAMGTYLDKIDTLTADNALLTARLKEAEGIVRIFAEDAYGVPASNYSDAFIVVNDDGGIIKRARAYFAKHKGGGDGNAE